MTIENITETIKGRLAQAADLKARVKFDFGAQGRIFVDLTCTPPVIDHEDREADVTLSCTLETFAGFLDGTKDPTFAFMTGALKIHGAMGLALKLNGLLEG